MSRGHARAPVLLLLLGESERERTIRYPRKLRNERATSSRSEIPFDLSRNLSEHVLIIEEVAQRLSRVRLGLGPTPTGPQDHRDVFLSAVN